MKEVADIAKKTSSMKKAHSADEILNEFNNRLNFQTLFQDTFN